MALTKVDAANIITGVLPVANGGTGASTQGGAANAVLPSQTGNSGKYLTTDGTDASWGTVTQLPIVATPTNTSPASGTTGVNPGQVLTASAFAALYGYTHANSQWQISTSSGFGTTVYDSGESGSATTTLTTNASYLSTSTTYYWRVRYKASDGTWSAYSTAFSFTTSAAFGFTVQVFLVGGGGGGAGGGYVAGAGGAGGYTTNASPYLGIGNTLTISIGGGGGGAGYGGAASSGGATTANGGGGFATNYTANGGQGGQAFTGGTGGSGGGSGHYSHRNPPGGGAGGSNGSNGGSNAEFSGGSGQGTTTYAFADSGTSLYAGGGGGGGSGWDGGSNNPGAGGAGGGGAGSANGGGGNNGSTNSGGGAGGAGGNYGGSTTGATGGSGVALIRYLGSSAKATGGTITGPTGGYMYHTFTSSGTFTVTSL